MTDGKIWLSAEIAPLFQKLQSKLLGFGPIVTVFSDDRPLGSASLHCPTLYPQLSVPRDKEGDWGEVARGIAHLISSLDGVPELQIDGNDTEIAATRDINQELQAIAVAKEKIKPEPRWVKEIIENLLTLIFNPAPGSFPAPKIFHVLRLKRLELDGHPLATHALNDVREREPDVYVNANALFSAIIAEDLRSAAGKAKAASLLLKAVNLDEARFYFQHTQYFPGIYDSRSLGYYAAWETTRAKFQSLGPSPGAWMKLQLPFALPVTEGIYETDNITALVKTIRIANSKAGWRAGQGGRIDTMANPAGLYSQSALEIWLPGSFSIDLHPPQESVAYKNLASFPEAIRVATQRLNGLISVLRVETRRSDIPEVLPSDLNQVSFKQFDENGNVTCNVLDISLERVLLISGAPNVKNEIHTDVKKFKPISFACELLESAKFQVSAYNPRRAVLDLAGAFEAFVAEVVTPEIGDMTLNTKDQFLRQYGSRLSEAACSEIRRVVLKGEEDPKRMPPVHRQLAEFKKRKLTPNLNKKHLSRVMKIMNIRNDAAHGRPIASDTIDELIQAIESLDALIKSSSQSFTTAPD
ncbi:hypothetical protein BH10PSE14_BH10PSE14_35580 [soil metagenome]